MSPESIANPSKQKTLFWWGLLAVALVGVSAAYFWDTGRRRSSGAALPVLGSVGDFQLKNQASRTVSQKDFLGKIWVADFIYTTCPDQCPMMSRRMQVIQSLLPEASGVQLVSISVDPDRDTPQALRRYGDKYHADFKRWHFLTGSSEAVAAIASRMKIAVVRIEGKPEIDHSDRLVLIDAKGQIRGYYSGVSDQDVQRLVKAVSQLDEAKRG